MTFSFGSNNNSAFGSNNNTLNNSFGFGNNNNNQNNNALPDQKWPNHLGNEIKPVEIQGAPSDTVSALNFTRQKVDNNLTYIAASSWSGETRVWEINTSNLQTQAKSENKQNAPVFDNCWSLCGKKVYLACADNKAYAWDLGSNQTTQIAQHNEPISCIKVLQINNMEIVMTGSWDKTLKFWNPNQPGNALFELNLDFKIYGADACYPVAVVIGSGTKFRVINFSSGTPQIQFKGSDGKDWPEKLNHQYSCVTIFKDFRKPYSEMPDGFALGATQRSK